MSKDEQVLGGMSRRYWLLKVQQLVAVTFVERSFNKRDKTLSCSEFPSEADFSMTHYVAYFRVSTARQGQSGLGLEAQQAAVRTFVGSDAHIVAEYVEIESGRKNSRPQLQAAIIHAKQEGAVLLVAKLDRLARNVAFLATLMESHVRFKAVDLPAADEFTLHILAAVAQKEATAISTRTRDALAAKKARGFQLGTPANLTPASREKALESLQHNAQQSLANRQAAQLAGLLRATGMSLRAIAARLNESGYRTRRGKAFHPMGVKRLLPHGATAVS